MTAEGPHIDALLKRPETREELIEENRRLLDELEAAYSNMERVLEESAAEKRIAYHELEKKVAVLESLLDDLTRKENMLMHMGKLSSIGEFIIELIHELKSPLSVISIQAQLAAARDLPPEARKRIDQIGRQVDRMADLLNRFRTMAYKGKEEFRVFDLNETLAECMETIEIIRPKGLEIDTVLFGQPLLVRGDPFQVTQIFLNFSRNAFDAMRSRGSRLRVVSERIEAGVLVRDEAAGWVYSREKDARDRIFSGTGAFAGVDFFDEGAGIPRGSLERVFEPFFTTKARGEGLGLGLSLCTDIARRHGGVLAVTSMEGRGTCFRLLLPLSGGRARKNGGLGLIR